MQGIRCWGCKGGTDKTFITGPACWHLVYLYKSQAGRIQASVAKVGWVTIDQQIDQLRLLHFRHQAHFQIGTRLACPTAMTHQRRPERPADRMRELMWIAENSIYRCPKK